jgi:hypothetical protein
MRDEKAKRRITCTHPLVFATITTKKAEHPSQTRKFKSPIDCTLVARDPKQQTRHHSAKLSISTKTCADASSSLARS